MAAKASSRPYQIVVWGASGFTGRLVCEHIARDYSDRISWAMAGRDVKKIESVRDDLARINPKVKDVPILVASAQDRASLGKVLKQTQVVLALVGPFAKYGTDVVEEAVEQGTSYCDITGEIPWVKRSVEKNDAKAKAKGVKVVHCCGYDSIPADLGALMMANYCKSTLKKPVQKVISIVMSGKGGISGGTIASALNAVQTEPTAELAKVSSDAYYLSHARMGTAKPAPFRPTWIPEASTWAAPWVMESVNAKIVQYSNSIRPQAYGKDFHYLEMSSKGQGWSGWAGATAGAVGLGLFGLAVATPPGRSLLRRVLPAPGQGPDEAARKSGFWQHRLYAVTETDESKTDDKPTIVSGVCGDQRDPGYWSTSRMILETGLALVLDADKIAVSGECLDAGVLTPATAAGSVLIERLRSAGFTWHVDGPMTKV